MDVKEFVEEVTRQIREGLEAGDAIPPIAPNLVRNEDSNPVIQARLGISLGVDGGKISVKEGSVDFNAQIEFPPDTSKGKSKKG